MIANEEYRRIFDDRAIDLERYPEDPADLIVVPIRKSPCGSGAIFNSKACTGISGTVTPKKLRTAEARSEPFPLRGLAFRFEGFFFASGTP